MELVYYALTFIGGVFADVLRKILVPQTDEWLETFLPHRRHARNVDRNVVMLDVRERLQRAGHDPALAAHVGDDVKVFLQKLEEDRSAKRDAFADVTADRLVAQAQTQAEMNEVAGHQRESADKLLSSTISRFLDEVDVSENAKAQLYKAQEAWEAFRAADAEFEALTAAEGGSILPLIRSMAMESAAISRIASFRSLREHLASFRGEGP